MRPLSVFIGPNPNRTAVQVEVIKILTGRFNILTRLRVWLRRTRNRIARNFAKFQRSFVSILVSMPTRNVQYFLLQRADQ